MVSCRAALEPRPASTRGPTGGDLPGPARDDVGEQGRRSVAIGSNYIGPEYRWQATLTRTSVMKTVVARSTSRSWSDEPGSARP
jgi:hypothetical protein